MIERLSTKSGGIGVSFPDLISYPPDFLVSYPLWLVSSGCAEISTEPSRSPARPTQVPGKTSAKTRYQLPHLVSPWRATNSGVRWNSGTQAPWPQSPIKALQKSRRTLIKHLHPVVGRPPDHLALTWPGGSGPVELLQDPHTSSIEVPGILRKSLGEHPQSTYLL